MLMFLAALLVQAAQAQTTAIEHYGPYAEGWSHSVTVTMSNVTTSTEIEINGAPRCGTITRLRWKLTSGSGTSMNPRVGDVASFVADSYDQVAAAETTAAQAVEVGSNPYCDPNRALFLRPGVNSGSDNTITVELLIGDGVKQ